LQCDQVLRLKPAAATVAQLLHPHLHGSSFNQGVRFSVQDASCGNDATNTCCRAAAGTQLLPLLLAYKLSPALLQSSLQLPFAAGESPSLLDSKPALLHAAPLPLLRLLLLLLLQLHMVMACTAVASGRATKLREVQNRLPRAWLKLPHWPARAEVGSRGLNFATNSCKWC
jgi:hypothetical protein